MSPEKGPSFQELLASNHSFPGDMLSSFQGGYTIFYELTNKPLEHTPPVIFVKIPFIIIERDMRNEGLLEQVLGTFLCIVRCNQLIRNRGPKKWGNQIFMWTE